MNVKQGDLAIIVGVQICPENNGRIVEVVRPFVKGERFGNSFKPTDTPGWLVRSVGTDLAILVTNKLTGQMKFNYVPERPYADRYLRPIRPQPEDAVDEMVNLVGKPEGVQP